MKFYEIDVTDFKKVQLVEIFYILNRIDNGWVDKIVNLEMIVDEKERIIIRGWATEKVWKKFLENLIYNNKTNYIYEKTKIEDLE